jgi:MFS family permease
MTESKLSFKEQMKGFPAWQMIVVSLIRFLEPIAFTSLFPYVYFMIRDFHFVKDEANISKYSGYLSASFAFTQFLCCIQWGKASDKVGRKPILIVGLFGTSLCMLTFGFSTNFYMALFARSAMGALNGNIAVLRTMIGEIATERKHQGTAFSILPLFWNVGSVIGPLIGGSKYLTRPQITDSVMKVNEGIYDRLLNKYPYALSNVVVALFLWFSMLMGFLFLEETHSQLNKRKDIGLEIGDWIRKRLGFDVPIRKWNIPSKTKPKRSRVPEPNRDSVDEREDVIQNSSNSNGNIHEDQQEEDLDSFDENTSLIQPRPIYSSLVDEDDETSSICSEDNLGPLTRRSSNALLRRYSSNMSVRPSLSRISTNRYSISDVSTINKNTFTREVFTGPVIQTMLGNFLLSFHTLVYLEFLPVLLASKFMPEELKFPTRLKGGFGYDSNTIGTLLSVTGLLGVFIIMLVFPLMDRNLRTITGYRISTSIFPLMYFMLPFLIYTIPGYNPKSPQHLTKTLLYLNSGIRTLASSTSTPQVIVLIHRASPPKYRAFINGTTLSLTALARCLAPLIWGALMSFFDSLALGQLTWITLAVMSVGALVQSFYIDEYDEDIKPTERDESNDQTV